MLKPSGIYNVKAYSEGKQVYNEDVIAGPRNKSHLDFIESRLGGLACDTVYIAEMDNGTAVKTTIYKHQPSFVFHREEVETDDFKLLDYHIYDFCIGTAHFVVNHNVNSRFCGEFARAVLVQRLHPSDGDTVVITWVDSKSHAGVRVGNYVFKADGRLVHVSGFMHEKN